MNYQKHKLTNHQKLKLKRQLKYGIKYVEAIYKNYTCIITNNKGLVHPYVNDADVAFFKAVDEAKKQRKELVINKIRYRPL